MGSATPTPLPKFLNHFSCLTGSCVKKWSDKYGRGERRNRNCCHFRLSNRCLVNYRSLKLPREQRCFCKQRCTHAPYVPTYWNPLALRSPCLFSWPGFLRMRESTLLSPRVSREAGIYSYVLCRAAHGGAGAGALSCWGK